MKEASSCSSLTSKDEEVKSEQKSKISYNTNLKSEDQDLKSIEKDKNVSVIRTRNQQAVEKRSKEQEETKYMTEREQRKAKRAEA